MSGDSPSSIERLEGTRVGGGAPDDADVCDSCNDVLLPGDPVVVFFTQTPLKPGFETPYAFRIHCMDCNPGELLWSPEGYSELLVQAWFTSDKTIVDIKPLDCSPASEGPPYEPIQTLSELFDFPEHYIIDEILDEEQLVSPQDFVHTLLENSMNPEDVVDMTTGEITVTGAEQLQFFERVFMGFKQTQTSYDGAVFQEDY